MNPIIKKNNIIKWKFENIDNLDATGRSSNEFTTDDLKWKIKVKTESVNGIKHLGVYLCHILEKSSWIIESSATIKIVNTEELKTASFDNGLHTKTVPGWGFFHLLKWSELAPKNISGSKIDSITVECEFSYKFYDFSKSSSMFADLSIKVGNHDLYVSKWYICTLSNFFNKEFVKNNESTITVTDVGSDDFIELLAAMMPDPIQITGGNYDTILDLSEKFEIDSLIKKCEKYFKKNKCVKIIRQIKEAEQVHDLTSIPTLLATLKRGKELKIVSEDENFKNFKDSTKVALMNAILKFV
ncbi:unnamed protein product [Caenorhabditis angaria]|uniref:BTB domain-containing protein n=1 Tax=Caenorhabditis angaria TaxID=860376 RepID=A0A9P1IJM9_9PELO|nr:unnamed protein product [Caenorhabditis angaria]